MAPSLVPGPDPAARVLGPDLVAAEQLYRELLFESFAFELRLGHRLGLVRAFASPRIASLLAHTGHVEHDTSRRGTDTGLFMYWILHDGLDSPVGRRAVQRLNDMHVRWPIRNEDYVWILSNWFLPGFRIIDRYGWRPLTNAERQAVVDWHCELAVRMGVRDLPATAAGFEAMAAAYERDHLRASQAGHRLRASVLEVAVRSLPRPVRPLGVRMGAVLIDDAVRRCLGLPDPGRVGRALVSALLDARARSRRWSGGHRGSWFVPGSPRRDYPNGYTIEDLGPAVSRE